MASCPNVSADQITEPLISMTDNHREDSLESLPSPKDEAHEPEQEHVKKMNLEKDFYSITVAETLNGFRLQHQWTDFTTGVNGNHFPVHKNVLAASCKFFMEFFNACEDDYYELTNVEPSALEDVLNFKFFTLESVRCMSRMLLQYSKLQGCLVYKVC